MAINEPDTAVKYDPSGNYFFLQCGQAQLPIYHCPFCGGSFPDSSKPIWVPTVPVEERQRVAALVADLRTAEEIVSRFGKPDYDELMRRYSDKAGRLVRDDSVPPIRNIEYYGLSQWFNIEFYLFADGTARVETPLKMLSPRHVDPA